MQKKAEEQKKRDEALAKKREETRASTSIRQVIQRMRFAPPQKFEEMKKELAEIETKELTNCGDQMAKVKAEIVSAVQQIDVKMKAIEEQKKKQAEFKAAEEVRRKEQEEKSQEKLKELSALVNQADEENKKIR
jgi:hypothetical protein